MVLGVASMDDDDWQEMPVVREQSPSSSSEDSDDGGAPAGYGPPGGSSSSRKSGTSSAAAAAAKKARRARHRSHNYSGNASSAGAAGMGPGPALGNATGRHLEVDDARGYNWRAAPSPEKDAKGSSKEEASAKGKKGKGKGSDSDDESDDSEGDAGASKGYTQLRLDDDVEGEELHAATEYLFGDGTARNKAGDDGLYQPAGGTGATPLSQLATTKQLLTEGQKIAYVGLVSLVARSLVRALQRVPGKEIDKAASAADEWRLRVMARLFQHMDIEASEQAMIESLAQHGVLSADLAPSLVTTQTIDNPDFDPEAEAERNAEREKERLLRQEKVQQQQEREGKEEQQRRDSEAELPIEDNKAVQEPEPEPEDDMEDVDLGQQADAATDKAAPAAKQPPPEDDGDIGTMGADSDDDENGDIGSARAPPPPYAPTDAKAAAVATADDDDGGDIASAMTPPAKIAPLAAADVKEKLKEEPSTLADPNTMAQLAEGENVTPLGLTAAPQTIDTLPSALEGVTKELSSADKTITLDLRWTVLCDLFLVLTADSVYDSRSRVLLEAVAQELGLTWMDVTKFEKRVTDALEIEEGVAGSLRGKKAVKKRAEMARRRRMVMMGLATVGGGLVIGLSAGLLAPVIGAGLGAALGTIGIGGTTGFLSGVGGAAIITSTATAGGMAIGGQGMNRRTRTVRTFEFKPVHNNKRVNCIVTVGGFMNGAQDDPRLPFSVIDSIMGDVFSVLWEPDMMQEMGNAIYLLWNETLVQGLQQVLAATIAGGLVGALAWPLWLTKLGWLIDNPWSNALDRAWSCGLILADVLSKRQLGVRPVTLVGFSLGARAIFYALVELAKQGKFGIVQNVYLIGAPVTASDTLWREARSVVAGRFVNAFSRTDWILGYLFRATTGGLRSIAGLHPVERVPDLENIDVTTTVPGHLQYRAFMPLVLDELGFRTTADYFDEPEDMTKIPEREIISEQLRQKTEEYELKSVKTKSGGFGKIFRRRQEDRKEGSSDSSSANTTPMDAASRSKAATPAPGGEYEYDDDDLPPREPDHPPREPEPPADATPKPATAVLPVFEAVQAADAPVPRSATPEVEKPASAAVHFDTDQILAELRQSGIEVRELESSLPPLVTSSAPLAVPRTEPRRDVVSPSGAATKPALHKLQPAPPSSGQSSGAGTPEPAPAPRRPSAAPAPYARSFNSAFDANVLPPPAPPALQTVDNMGGLSLSFAESYDDDEDDEDDEEQPQTARAAPAAAPMSADVAKGYGLSSDAARELAQRFAMGDAAPAVASPPLPAPIEEDGWGSGSTATLPLASSARARSPSPPPPMLPAGAEADWSSPDPDVSVDSTASFDSSVGAPSAPPRSLAFGRLADEETVEAASSPTLAAPSKANEWGAENPWG